MNVNIRKLVLGLTAVSLGALLFASSASATEWTYPAPSGAPWTNSNSAFDWTNWFYSDNLLYNKASSTRTWTVSLHPQVSSSANVNLYIDFWACSNSTVKTTGQAISNQYFGTRYMALTPVQIPLADCMYASAVPNNAALTVPPEGNAYVNYVVGSNGILSDTFLTQ